MTHLQDVVFAVIVSVTPWHIVRDVPAAQNAGDEIMNTVNVATLENVLIATKNIVQRMGAALYINLKPRYKRSKKDLEPLTPRPKLYFKPTIRKLGLPA